MLVLRYICYKDALIHTRTSTVRVDIALSEAPTCTIWTITTVPYSTLRYCTVPYGTLPYRTPLGHLRIRYNRILNFKKTQISKCFIGFEVVSFFFLSCLLYRIRDLFLLYFMRPYISNPIIIFAGHVAVIKLLMLLLNFTHCWKSVWDTRVVAVK
jgi:hypothetical protein